MSSNSPNTGPSGSTTQKSNDGPQISQKARNALFHNPHKKAVQRRESGKASPDNERRQANFAKSRLPGGENGPQNSPYGNSGSSTLYTTAPDVSRPPPPPPSLQEHQQQPPANTSRDNSPRLNEASKRPHSAVDSDVAAGPSTRRPPSASSASGLRAFSESVIEAVQVMSTIEKPPPRILGLPEEEQARLDAFLAQLQKDTAQKLARIDDLSRTADTHMTHHFTNSTVIQKLEAAVKSRDDEIKRMQEQSANQAKQLETQAQQYKALEERLLALERNGLQSQTSPAPPPVYTPAPGIDTSRFVLKTDFDEQTRRLELALSSLDDRTLLLLSHINLRFDSDLDRLLVKDKLYDPQAAHAISQAMRFGNTPIHSNLAALHGRVDAAEIDITAADNRLNVVELAIHRIGPLENQLAGLEVQHKGLEEKFKVFIQKMRNLREQLTQVSAQQHGRERSPNQVQESTHAEDIASLRKQIDAMPNRVSELIDRILSPTVQTIETGMNSGLDHTFATKSNDLVAKVDEKLEVLRTHIDQIVEEARILKSNYLGTTVVTSNLTADIGSLKDVTGDLQKAHKTRDERLGELQKTIDLTVCDLRKMEGAQEASTVPQKLKFMSEQLGEITEGNSNRDTLIQTVQEEIRQLSAEVRKLEEKIQAQAAAVQSDTGDTAPPIKPEELDQLKQTVTGLKRGLEQCLITLRAQRQQSQTLPQVQATAPSATPPPPPPMSQSTAQAQLEELQKTVEKHSFTFSDHERYMHERKIFEDGIAAALQQHDAALRSDFKKELIQTVKDYDEIADQLREQWKALKKEAKADQEQRRSLAGNVFIMGSRIDRLDKASKETEVVCAKWQALEHAVSAKLIPDAQHLAANHARHIDLINRMIMPRVDGKFAELSRDLADLKGKFKIEAGENSAEHNTMNQEIKRLADKTDVVVQYLAGTLPRIDNQALQQQQDSAVWSSVPTDWYLQQKHPLASGVGTSNLSPSIASIDRTLSASAPTNPEENTVSLRRDLPRVYEPYNPTNAVASTSTSSSSTASHNNNNNVYTSNGISSSMSSFRLPLPAAPPASAPKRT